MARELIKPDVTIRNPNPTDRIIRLSNGDGLHLLIKPNGAKWWRFDYSINGRRKTLSLGVYPDTGLAAARARADSSRQLVAVGTDPSDARKANKETIAKASEAGRRIADGLPAIDSFSEVLQEWLAKKQQSWAASQYDKINRRMNRDVLPWLGDKPIAAIKAMDVLAVLRRQEARGVINSALDTHKHRPGFTLRRGCWALGACCHRWPSPGSLRNC